MLAHLAIRDFAIVHRLELDLGPGLTVLTGETGAGKSILVDALVLVLGGRARPDAVRPGRPRAEITALFDLADAPELAARLARLELATEEGECILRRLVEAQGRSRAFVNGRAVPVQILRELCQGVVEVHGQHAHHSLLRPEHQRRLLDALGGHEAELAAVRAAHGLLVEGERRREALLATLENREARADYLRFQLEELESLSLSEPEIEDLVSEQRRLAHAQEITQTCAFLERALAGEEAGDAASVVRETVSRSQRLATLDPAFAEVARSLGSALIEIEEANRAVRAYARSLDASPQRLEEVEARLSRLHDLARKHRVKVEELPRRTRELRCEASRLSSVQAELDILEGELARARADYQAAALSLRGRRQRSAPTLSRAVNALLSDLGMADAELSVRVTPLDDAEPLPAAHGRDRVEFWVRTNAGHEPAPLARIASGGELSRISLALQVAGATRTGSATLVFDEVDVGVGGRVAAQVGRRLRELAGTKQVICITHLAQVAAQGSSHLRVRKRQEENMTLAELETLGGDERVAEIARMLGGVRITSRTLAHAQEMLSAETDV